ncbi:hypothetical protein SORBI_3002G104450 [Sorghum bicolor]|uniref:Uncharacterized protein n=1 Tax=Sorghum bicolor TaxID=4558 RepID=A0A1W0W392_SORBI|nr:hypothetical protein SORBI_3002G104450 [Sorghum bicolor]
MGERVRAATPAASGEQPRRAKRPRRRADESHLPGAGTRRPAVAAEGEGARGYGEYAGRGRGTRVGLHGRSKSRSGEEELTGCRCHGGSDCRGKITYRQGGDLRVCVHK